MAQYTPGLDLFGEAMQWTVRALVMAVACACIAARLRHVQALPGVLAAAGKAHGCRRLGPCCGPPRAAVHLTRLGCDPMSLQHGLLGVLRVRWSCRVCPRFM